MAIVAHLVERTASAGGNQIDGITAAIVAVDDTVDTTDAAVRARAASVLQAEGIAVPDDYFTSNRSVAGTFDAAGDHVVWEGDKITETVA